MKTVRAYHFTGDKLRNGDPLPLIGRWLRWDGSVSMCASGLHASREPWHALQYAPGALLHQVECRSIVAEEKDKLVCRERRIIRSGDATELLRYFARMQALSVSHLWDAPEVVLDFLMSGDETSRVAARAAAWDAWAARAAACDAALDTRAAAWDAWAAACAAVWDVWAARDAARSAAAARGRSTWSAARTDFNSLVAEFFA